jgi:two-component system chemotaxis sensor kinase CheA
MRPVVVVGGPDRHAAFLVDQVTETHEVMIKSLPAPLFRVRYLAGATILGSGRVAIILNPTDLLGSVERAGAYSLGAVAPADPVRATILVVEDSITTRTLEKNILEAAGYLVRTAKDGAQGWSDLQSDVFDLVVADVEMPMMDGFELVGRIRADERYRHLPVVLVTSRDSLQDRERGIHAGADAYIVKGGFDQDHLLETIRRLI